MLIPYEQLYIQTYHKNGLLIPEQHTGGTNPLFQLITNTITTNTLKHYQRHCKPPTNTVEAWEAYIPPQAP
jgi:hypothetical protein